MRGRSCRHVDTPAAEELFGIFPVDVHSVIIIAEQGPVIICQIPHEAVPVDHLGVFVGHVMTPDQIIAAAPEAVQGKRVRCLVCSADKQIAAVFPHFFHELRRLFVLIGAGKQIFVIRILPAVQFQPGAEIFPAVQRNMAGKQAFIRFRKA